jgi:hypothetical protein
MKTLKKNGEFKRVKDSDISDRKIIDGMINQGWQFSSKKEWKENTRTIIDEKEDKPKKKRKNKN